ncbi:MAG: hypothetical protein SGI99_05495, partial [Pseudomonadota bacterium]|nr:hypothetical protein [Pseudomonadota bacterium]
TAYDKPTLGGDPQSLVGKHVRIRFKVKCAGAGAAGTVPAFGPMLECCGYTATVSAGVSVAYASEDTGISSGTLHFKADGVLHTVVYCKGSLVITGQTKQYGHMEFEFMGLYVAPTAAGAITPVYTAFQVPVPFRASTASVTWNAVALGTHEIKVTGGQKIDFYEHSEAESIELEDRKAMCDLKFEEPAIGTTDIFALCTAETKAALVYQLGTVAGNIFRVNAPLFQPLKPKRGDVKGNSSIEVSGQLIADGTTPDHTITVL